jgi:hypothetical protein
MKEHSPSKVGEPLPYFTVSNGVLHLQLNSELARLDYIITDNIAGFIKMNCILDPDLASGFENALMKEGERIENKWTQIAVNLTESDRYRYVNLHQHHLVRLTGCLLSYTTVTDLYAPVDTLDHHWLCRVTFRLLTGLLAYLEKHFGQYIDRLMSLTKNYQNIIAHEVCFGIEELERALLEVGIDAKTVRLVLTPFRKLRDDCSAHFVYHQIRYLRELKERIFSLTREHGEEPRKDLHYLLYSLNFNYDEYCKYVVTLIGSDVREEETVSGQLCRLAALQRELEQVWIVPGMAFDRAARSIVEHVTTWINSETKYLERFRLIKEDNTGGDQLLRDIHIEMSLSAAQMAYLFRILIETGIIRTDNIVKFLRVVAGIFQTTGQKELSYKSLRNKFYNVEDTVRQSIQHTLQHLTAWTKKDTT